jgi:hypothetical protein
MTLPKKITGTSTGTATESTASNGSSGSTHAGRTYTYVQHQYFSNKYRRVITITKTVLNPVPTSSSASAPASPEN